MMESTNPARARPGPKRKYQFPDLAVGDSQRYETGGDEKIERRVRAAASFYGKTNGRTMSVKRVDGGVRVWRME